MFDNDLIEAAGKYNRVAEMYNRAEALVKELGLDGIEQYVQRTHVYQDCHYKTDRTDPDWPVFTENYLFAENSDPLVHVSLWISAENKAAARKKILADSTVNRWAKTTEFSDGYVSERPVAYEQWHWEGEGDWEHGRDSLDIRFYWLVQAGDEMAGCEVEEYTYQSPRLRLACQREQ